MYKLSNPSLSSERAIQEWLPIRKSNLPGISAVKGRWADILHNGAAMTSLCLQNSEANRFAPQDKTNPGMMREEFVLEEEQHATIIAALE
jgi:hypothetical protein